MFSQLKLRLPGFRIVHAHSLLIIALVCAVLCFSSYSLLSKIQPAGHAAESNLPKTSVSADSNEPNTTEVHGVFKRNETFADVLQRHNVSHREIHRMVESARPVYNLAKVKANRSYWITLTSEGELHDFRYPIDDEEYLTVYKHEQGYVPIIKEFPFETRVEPVSGVIQDSLFLSVTRAGEKDQLALDLADIFMWDIDFYTDIRKGDSYSLLVEKKYLKGKLVKYGPILVASMTNRGEVFTGFRFGDDNVSPGYFAADGSSMKRSFLKSPLKFGRISSRFSHARFHPILKVVRPHLGVDYAAPTGSPVVAVGAGVVRLAGRRGGNGKMVKLRHTQSYETQYLHLSRIAVRKGQRVAQGDLIGYVGSTGLATGPHLDFRVTRFGKYLNPTKVVFPPLPPVPRASFDSFASVRDELRTRLDQMTH